ncbi:hypothetical protein ACIBQX_18595 [Nonomuraea sp. NPDC049714]
MTPHEEAMERLAQDLTGDLDRLNRWQSARPTETTDEHDPKPRGKR